VRIRQWGTEAPFVGTDCGFGTAAGMGRVAEDVVWAKLEALAAGARLASRR
jgi:5-methyltetrahydropteroyltriglutamate--homocysteine methyltransferase